MCGGNAVCLGFAPTDEDAYECALKPYRIYRARGGEGLMVKERDSMHEVGRTEASGSWWKRKIDLYAVDAVLVYAQRGRRAGLILGRPSALSTHAANRSSKLISRRY
jgi:ATP-dependent DNA ligase